MSARAEAQNPEPRSAAEAYRLLFEQSGEMVCILDLEGRFTSVNPAGERLTGYSSAELLGRLAVELIAPELPEHAARQFQQRLDGDAAPDETVLITRDGKQIPVLVTSSLISHDGRPTGVLGLITDLTVRRNAESALRANAETESHLRDAEARFRSFFESAPIGKAIVAPDGRFLAANTALCDLVGRSEPELLAMRFQDITHPDDLDADLEFVRQMLAGEIRMYQMEKRYLHRDGHIVWAVLSVSLVRSSSGEPSYFISQIQDITERRGAEAERDRLRDDLHAAQKLEALGRLAGGVAHDFNNMLTAIKGYSELLLDGLQPGTRLHHQADQIRRAAQQASSLPEQLLAFARRQPLEAQLVDLNALAVTASVLLRHLVGEQIALNTVPAPRPVLAYVDPVRIEQLLVNLALNARDAMPTGGTLTVATATIDVAADSAADADMAAGPYAAISVSDDGPGMDAETRERAFEPFFTTKPEGKGSGLGLASVHGAVSQSGGFVRIESEPGRGATFHLYFPAAEPLPAGDAKSDHGPAAVVLLAEDEDLVRELVSSVLEGQGFEVHATRSGREALEQLERLDRPIDLLVTDLVMPGMGGRELAERVNERQPNARTVFISGYSGESPTLIRGALRDSAYLGKPFSPAALVETVNTVIARPVSSSGPDGDTAGVTCVIADDHPAVLDSVSRYLELAGIGVVARVSRSDEALREIEAHQPMIALVDITMEPFSGIEVARRAGVSSPQTSIVVYTGHHDHALLREAVTAGARGFVLKETPLSELVRALTTVAAGGTYVDVLLAGALATAATTAPIAALTKRERQILTLLSGGMTNEKVAKELGISAETVQSHVRNAMTKLDADTRTQAVATAIRQALIV